MADGNRSEFVSQKWPTDTSPLLGNPVSRPNITSGPEQPGKLMLGRDFTPSDIIKNATWKEEIKIGVAYAAPLVVTFLLQYSIDVASVVVAGRLGKIELGAVSCKSISLFLDPILTH